MDTTFDPTRIWELPLPELTRRRKRIHLDQIRVDGDTQMRAALNPDTVADYAEAFRGYDGWGQFPPVVLFQEGAVHWVGDGYHRIAGWREAFGGDAPHDCVHASVHPGTRRDAILYAVYANNQHGLRRTNADKRRAVETLLRDDEWRQWSDAEIARRCAVDHKTVAKIRAELYPGKSQDAGRKVSRNGATYTQDTTNIGRKAAPAPPPAEPTDTWAAGAVGLNRDWTAEELDAYAAANEVITTEPEPPTEPGSPLGASALDDLPLVAAEEFPGPTDAEREDRRHTYAWLRTIYQEARDAVRMYEEMTGDFASRGPLLRTLEPMLAALDRHLAVYETTQEEQP